MSTHVGVVIADRGAAIVGIEREDDALLCVGIERLPAEISAVIARLADLGDEVYRSVDADGLGNALWAALGPPEDAEHWRLYSGRGAERQALVDRLLVAIHQDTFRFAPGLAEQESMSKALVGYRRAVKEDGLIGSELVVALLLALIPPPPVEWPPLFAWGGDDEDDEIDGTLVGGLTLHVAPDGTLVGTTEPAEKSDD